MFDVLEHSVPAAGKIIQFEEGRQAAKPPEELLGFDREY
jgi:hypothetical protein